MCVGVCANIGHHSTSSAIGVASPDDRHQYTEWLHPVPPELQPIQKEICWLTEHSHTYTHTYMSHLPHHISGGKCVLSLRIIQLMFGTSHWEMTATHDCILHVPCHAATSQSEASLSTDSSSAQYTNSNNHSGCIHNTQAYIHTYTFTQHH